MSLAIDPIGALPPSFAAGSVHGPATATPGSSDFATWFGAQLQSVDAKVRASEQGLQALAAGETDNLHHVMLNLEEARLSFQLLAQVRNRLLESYQDLMRMQV